MSKMISPLVTYAFAISGDVFSTSARKCGRKSVSDGLSLYSRK